MGHPIGVASATMGRMLVVMSGLPGTGKSAIADALCRELGAPVLSVDPIEAAIWRCGIAPSFETGVAAYEVAAVLAEHSSRSASPRSSIRSVQLGWPVIWRQAASRAGGQMRVI